MGGAKETRIEQVSSILIFSKLLINYEHKAEDEKRVERERESRILLCHLEGERVPLNTEDRKFNLKKNFLCIFVTF